jgi:hypothetical protein
MEGLHLNLTEAQTVGVQLNCRYGDFPNLLWGFPYLPTVPPARGIGNSPYNRPGPD